MEKRQVTVTTRFRQYRSGEACWLTVSEIEAELQKPRPAISLTGSAPADREDLDLVPGLDRDDVAVLGARGIYRFDQLARPDSMTSAVLEGFYRARPLEESRLRRVVRRFQELVLGGDDGLAGCVKRLRAEAAARELDLGYLEALDDEALEDHLDRIRAAYVVLVGSRPGRRGARTLLAEIRQAREESGG